MPPEPPVDPPSTADDTPVDRLEVMLGLLGAAEHELSRAEITPKQRALLEITIGALQDQVEIVR